MKAHPTPATVATESRGLASALVSAKSSHQAPPHWSSRTINGSKLALAALLKRIRLSVVAVESGHTALDALAERDDIAIVLMDILMPIIAVTGKDTAGERARCIAAGASDYIAKPIDTPVLLTAIATSMTPEEPAPSARR